MVSLDPLGTVECGLNIMMVGYSEKGKYGPEHTVPFRSLQAFTLSGPARSWSCGLDLAEQIVHDYLHVCLLRLYFPRNDGECRPEPS